MPDEIENKTRIQIIRVTLGQRRKKIKTAISLEFTENNIDTALV